MKKESSAKCSRTERVETRNIAMTDQMFMLPVITVVIILKLYLPAIPVIMILQWWCRRWSGLSTVDVFAVVMKAGTLLTRPQMTVLSEGGLG